MPDLVKLKRPWLVAVWPGMGHVALSAGFYLLAKLGMHQISELTGTGLFDVDQVVVKRGRIQPTQRPRNRFFLWQAPEGQRDIVVFIGEAQPPMGKYPFCENLIDYARDLGVERLFTFAAMATQMPLEQPSRVFVAATEDVELPTLGEDGLSLEVLQEGYIGGLNGVLLGAAADKGMPGTCLLGEMPHVFAQLPFPKASLAVLKVFATMAEIKIDFAELTQQAEAVEHRLSEFLAKIESQFAKAQQQAEEEPNDELAFAPMEEDDALDPQDAQRIEDMFEAAEADRTKAYELKSELDRLEVFPDYEDRFLDLFKQDN